MQRSWVTVTIEVGPTTINEQLAVGGVSQEVVVNTDVPLLKTENGEQTITLSAETLQALPEVGQDYRLQYSSSWSSRGTRRLAGIASCNG